MTPLEECLRMEFIARALIGCSSVNSSSDFWTIYVASNGAPEPEAEPNDKSSIVSNAF